MPLTQVQIRAAQTTQHAAAHEQAQQVRLIAGPGTGKSFVIEERIHWLLNHGISPKGIYVVSFTRASALDLRDRVHRYCIKNGCSSVTQVRVTTLHSLALRTLRAAGLLAAYYPADPLVLDSWELEKIFDAEFGDKFSIKKKERREKIRLDHEAFWSTGQWGPPNYVLPDPPITRLERQQFEVFHKPRTQCYSCVLPGEVIRQCVNKINAGVLNTVVLLKLEHLVVDEFQDLNPMDLKLIDTIAKQGSDVFVAGDDDQSIYSFRFASPAGIQNFVQKYSSCRQHTLSKCFRCTPNVLTEAQMLITANPGPNRIVKNYISLYGAATPPLSGVVHRWRFNSGIAEARAVAKSCSALIASGLNPRDILVLISNKRVLLPDLRNAFQSASVEYEPPRTESFLDSEIGRLVLAISRIVCDTNDYVAHRVLLGLRPGVGIKTCNNIAEAVIGNNLNYRAIFYDPLPSAVFGGRALKAVNNVRNICSQIQGWQANDTISQRMADIASIVLGAFGASDVQTWKTYATKLPANMILKELRDYLWADTDEQQAAILEGVLNRLNLPLPTTGILPSRVRIMTMHGAKGLSGKVVFIPGLEENILPGPRRKPYPGLVLEAARLLYMSITRAQVACVISYAKTRIIHGKFQPCKQSRFATDLNGPFVPRIACLNGAEIQSIMKEVFSL